MSQDTQQQEEHVSGNIWGWKFSLTALVIIGLLLALMIYRHIALGVPFGGEENIDPTQIELPHHG